VLDKVLCIIDVVLEAGAPSSSIAFAAVVGTPLWCGGEVVC
jgi:hypothetical protein